MGGGFWRFGQDRARSGKALGGIQERNAGGPQGTPRGAHEGLKEKTMEGLEEKSGENRGAGRAG